MLSGGRSEPGAFALLERGRWHLADAETFGECGQTQTFWLSRRIGAWPMIGSPTSDFFGYTDGLEVGSS